MYRRTKRIVDIIVSAGGLVILSPVLLLASIAIWMEDRRTPIYIALRVGKGGVMFRMLKLRSMVVGADRSGVDSTAADDPRVTQVGRLIRAMKIDEIPQLWNVLRGDMSLVGPRPNVERDVQLYTREERRLLDVQPGITDVASIVFADEADILEGAADPDLKYNQVIRPWKSRLGLFYIDNRSLWLDAQIVMATVVNVVSRSLALRLVSAILVGRCAEEALLRVARRSAPLEAAPPPGADQIVCSRDTRELNE